MMGRLAMPVLRRWSGGAVDTPRHGFVADRGFVIAVTVLVLLGILMVGSSSIAIADRELGQPFYYVQRQVLYVLAGLVAMFIVRWLPLIFWQRISGGLLGAAVLLLLLVLVPGIGHEVNGSARWLSLVFINLQPSELAKLFVILYLAGYLVRRGDEVRSQETRVAVLGFVKPIIVLAALSVLLLAEPDFGAAAIMMSTAMILLFLGGVRVWQFGILLSCVGLSLAVLAVSSPYRLERITAFLDPWADPFASGFQLTQALIAFGRGEWFGVGLGNSIQKLFYLPEAHTDFLFAVMAEELGLVGSLVVLALFMWLVLSIFRIGRRAERSGATYAAYVSYGIGSWIALQTLTNIGVNMGVLPTKGLTLPLMSYGGSSLLVTCVALALLQRVAHETALARVQARPLRKAEPS